jgi:hypothetical protein
MALALGDIDLDEGGFTAIFRNHMDGLVSTLVIHVHNDEFRSLPSKRQSCSSPNP